MTVPSVSSMTWYSNLGTKRQHGNPQIYSQVSQKCGGLRTLLVASEVGAVLLVTLPFNLWQLTCVPFNLA